MDPLKEKIFNTLNFSPAERRGMIVLIFIMLGIIYILPLLQNPANDTEEIKIETKYYTFKYQISNSDNKELLKTDYPELFEFDPNQTSALELKQLGFQDYLVERIIKYRNSGGNFKTKEDLKKIYGLKPALYNRIEPYIKIKDRTSEVKIEKEKKSAIHININEADSLSLLTVSGIGPVYAARILKYRNSLGGFSHLEQLKEVYGIDDSLYNIISGSFHLKQFEDIRTIEINKVSLKDLRKHPYFRDFNISRTIIRFRENHGAFRTISDLREIHLLNDSILQKIEPYVSFSTGSAEEHLEK